MIERRNKTLHLPNNTEPLPGEFGADLVRLDEALAGLLTRVEAPADLGDRIYAASLEHLEAPAALPFRSSPLVVTMRQRRTMWARVAVAASLTVLVTLAGRVVMNSSTSPVKAFEPEAMTASLSPALPDELEMLLLDRSPDRQGEEIAYLFDPDVRESSDMSLYVQTREVSLDDVSYELAQLEYDQSM